MKAKEIKQKGRRLQTEVAEFFAATFALTIQAVPPTQPGRRVNGAVYVPEGPAADLCIRRMSQAGTDIGLLSDRARLALSRKALEIAAPLCIECKNTQNWDLGSKFWQTGSNAYIDRMMEKLTKVCPGGQSPVLIVSKNNWEPIAVWKPDALEAEMLWQEAEVFMLGRRYMYAGLTAFASLLRGSESL